MKAGDTTVEEDKGVNSRDFGACDNDDNTANAVHCGIRRSLNQTSSGCWHTEGEQVRYAVKGTIFSKDRSCRRSGLWSLRAQIFATS